MRKRDLLAILAETPPSSLFVGLENAEGVVAALGTGTSVRNLIVIDVVEGNDLHHERLQRVRQALAATGAEIVLSLLQDAIAAGRDLPPAPAYNVAEGDNPKCGLVYSSGSTGTPKGVEWRYSSLAPWWYAPAGAFPVVSLAYMPLNHAMGRGTIINTFRNGGLSCFTTKSDMSTLFEDARLVRPTLFDFVPRVAELIYHHFMSELDRRSDGRTDEAALRHEIMADMRANFMGGRLQAGMIGSAPSTAEMREFIRECFNIPLPNIYGSTEAGVVSANGVINRGLVLDCKLRDVPELGYFTTDKPHPRGELLVKTRGQAHGYFNNPELSKALTDKDGFQVTGDIVAEIGPDTIEVIDRRNNVLKLSQGEFVAVSRLESIFVAGSPLIHQIYLYGTGSRPYLLAVVVPNLDGFTSASMENPDDAAIRQQLRAEMQEIGQREALSPYEIPRDFIVEHEEFSHANGLLSNSSKMLRKRLAEKYGDRLESLYREHEARELLGLESLRRGDARTTIAERVRRAVAAKTGLLEADIAGDRSFADLGGDSLAALELSLLLEEIFSVEVPVSTILGPACTLDDLAAHIEAAVSATDSALGSYALVHGD